MESDKILRLPSPIYHCFNHILLILHWFICWEYHSLGGSNVAKDMPRWNESKHLRNRGYVLISKGLCRQATQRTPVLHSTITSIAFPHFTCNHTINGLYYIRSHCVFITIILILVSIWSFQLATLNIYEFENDIRWFATVLEELTWRHFQCENLNGVFRAQFWSREQAMINCTNYYTAQ